MSWQTLGDMFCAALLTWLAVEWLALGVIAAVVALRKLRCGQVVPLSKEEGDRIFSYRVRLDRDSTQFGDGLNGATSDVKEVVMGR